MQGEGWDVVNLVIFCEIIYFCKRNCFTSYYLIVHCQSKWRRGALALLIYSHRHDHRASTTSCWTNDPFITCIRCTYSHSKNAGTFLWKWQNDDHKLSLYLSIDVSGHCSLNKHTKIPKCLLICLHVHSVKRKSLWRVWKEQQLMAFV